MCVGMVGIGGFFIMGGGYLPTTVPEMLGAASVLLAFMNVSGGFVVTKRMLDMFKRKSLAFPRACLLTPSQAPLILPNTHGFMLYPQLYSAEDSLLLRARAWRA